MRILHFIAGARTPHSSGSGGRLWETAFPLRPVARSQRASHRLMQVSMRELKSAVWHLPRLSRDCEFRYAADRNAVPNAKLRVPVEF